MIIPEIFKHTFRIIVLIITVGHNVLADDNLCGADRQMVSVICHGIPNDGSPIGPALNDLIVNSYGKTVFFPAGVYTLTEPIMLPFDYTKNVNIHFDHSALIRCDSIMDALVKVGFSEMSTPDKSQRRFSFIEGGKFDCSNVANGILINGLKQLVSLRSISLFKGNQKHITIQVTDDFQGTGSADTKIDNITIQGISSNDDVHGIYIDSACADVKISNSFIYGTTFGITTKSAGHIINNVHILSQVTTGGTDRGPDNFTTTQGIRIESNGFFILNEIYFDTVNRCIVIPGGNRPELIIDKNIYYSYLDHFGQSFLYRDSTAPSAFQAKISNSLFHIRRAGYKIFDVNPSMIGYDVNEYFTFVNSTVKNPHLIDPYDASLLQKTRKKNSDALVFTNLGTFDTDWHVMGSIIASPYRSRLKIDLANDEWFELNLKFNGSSVVLLDSMVFDPANVLSFDLGYIVENGFCILLFKPTQQKIYYPVINDLLGNGSYLTTPSRDKYYRLADYALSGNPTILLKN